MRDLADELLAARVKARLFGGDHAPRLGRLVILDRIGSGATGTVYAAYDPRLERKVAVKVLNAADAASNARFLREARALGKLAHPNVVAIHDAGETDGAVHVVMELAPGVPLRAWIGGDRDWRDVIRVLREAGAGLAAAHRAGLVHRDIKPDNILVGDDRARVVDFGLARDEDDPTDLGGTPSYMAPEVLANRPATPASDQFSFGVTLYEALHGERPHTGTTRRELQTAALGAAKARPGPAAARDPAAAARDPAAAARDPAAAARESPRRRRSADPPGWVHAIVRRALAALPADRFPSMDALVAELGRDRRRQRRVAGIAAGALALGAAAGAIAYRSQTPAAGDPCSGGAPRRAAAWSEPAAARVRTQLGATPWAAAAISTLDRAAGDWEASFRRVCEATRVRGEQADRLLELRMRCLDRALDRFTALVAALDGPLDAAGRSEAANAAAQLPPPDACEAMTDAGELALPAAPADRARAIAAERELDGAWAAYALSRYRDARTRVTALDTATADLDAAPLRAAILALVGAVESRAGDPAAARAVLHRALIAAATAHAPELELAVWTRLLRHELFSGQPAHAIDWADFARAAAARAGRDGAELDGIVGEALRNTGRLADARARLQRALASRDPLRGDQRALIEMNLGSVELAAGRSLAAAPAFQHAHDAARAVQGEGHPSLAIYLDKLADADRARGRLRDAMRLHDRSVELRRAAFGPDDRSLATALYHRAETAVEAGHLSQAERDLAAARTIRAKLFGDHSARLGELDVVLGDLAAARGRPADARALYDRAAALDARLDLAARRHAAGAPLDLSALPASIEPFSADRAAALALRATLLPAPAAASLAAALLARWRAAGPVDAALSLAVADAQLAAGDRLGAAAVYHAAAASLSDEPSLSRLRAYRGLARSLDGDAATAASATADTLARAMPDLPALP